MEGLIIWCIIATTFIVVLLYTTLNLLRKNEKLEELFFNKEETINKIQESIKLADLKLKEIDKKGSFKGDDEIGWFFKNIMYIQDILNQYNLNEKESTKN